MKTTYWELFGLYYDRYFGFKSENMSDREAIARTYGEFEGDIEGDEMGKAVTAIAEAKVCLTHSKIFYKSKEVIKAKLNNLDLEKLHLELDDASFRDLMELREEVLDKIDEIPVDYCSIARWYYYDMQNEVIRYLGGISSEDYEAEEIPDIVFKRFRRECKNTLSENIVIKVTLAEVLINRDIKAEGYLKNLKRELKQFKIEELNEQLLINEKIDLSKRIANILKK